MPKWMTGCAVAVTAVLAGTSVTTARELQDPEFPVQQPAPDRTRVHRHAPLRVYVTPAGRYYRQCIDHPVVEHRATGDTVVPWFTCRWIAQ
jgi:hypothetical protein